MKVDQYYNDEDLANDYRFWQYKVYADIRDGSQDLCKFSWFYAYVLILRIHVPHAFSLWSSSALFIIVTICQYAAAGCKVRTTGRRCGKRISEMWSAEYLESAEKLQIFRRCYIVGILTNKANVSI